MNNTAQDDTINNQQAPVQNQTDLNPLPTDTIAQQDKISIGQNQYMPTSSLSKEKGGSGFSEIVRPSEQEVKIEQELKDVGVEVSSDKPKLDEIHEQIGVKASAESTPVLQASSNKVVLPMTEEEADQTIKSKQSSFHLHENVGEFAGEYTEDSKPFFATLIKKVFKEMHKRVFSRK